MRDSATWAKSFTRPVCALAIAVVGPSANHTVVAGDGVDGTRTTGAFSRDVSIRARLERRLPVAKQVVSHTQAGVEVLPAHGFEAWEVAGRRHVLGGRHSLIGIVGPEVIEPQAQLHGQSVQGPQILREDPQIRPNAVVRRHWSPAVLHLRRHIVQRGEYRIAHEVRGILVTARHPVVTDLQGVAARHVVHRPTRSPERYMSVEIDVTRPVGQVDACVDDTWCHRLRLVTVTKVLHDVCCAGLEQEPAIER